MQPQFRIDDEVDGEGRQRVKVYWLCPCGEKFLTYHPPEEHQKICLPWQVNQI